MVMHRFLAGTIVCALLAVACALTGCPKPSADVVSVVAFASDVQVGEAPLSVHFTDLSHVPPADVTHHLWDFGDGQTSTETAPAHLYAAPGEYSVKLEITTVVPGGTVSESRENLIVALDPNRDVGSVAGEKQTFAGIDFVWIPAGTFEMGATSNDFSAQPETLPVHTVTITRGFWLGEREVTQAQWEAVMNTNPSLFSTDTGAFPVEQVSWFDAQVFVDRLNLSGEGVFRLPSEAEWEYACRAGTQTAYSFGDDVALLPSYGWFWDNARYETFSTGELLPNAWGLYDMHGNVREWCQDRFAANYYSSSPGMDPRGPDLGIYRTTRGGAWIDNGHLLESCHRFFSLPASKSSEIGIRVVRQ